MSVLSDISIKESIRKYNYFKDNPGECNVEDFIGIEPYDPSLVQPCSIDVRLGDELTTVHGSRYKGEILVAPKDHTGPLFGGYTPYKEYLNPHEFLLGHTLETVSIPSNILCTISGKSSLGRLGLCVHATAGFIDPGFKGQITLELFNMSSVPIKLTSGMLIAQLSFQYLDLPAEKPYGHPDLKSHYQGQTGATPSAQI